MTSENLTSPRVQPLATPSMTLTRLAASLLAHAPFDGSHALRLPGLYAVRASRMSSELIHGVYQPSLCIVAQGAKRVLLGPDIYDYDASRMLLCSVELPVASQIVEASPGTPFLSLKLHLEPRRVAELALRVYPHGLPPLQESRGVGVGNVPAEIIGAATRLVELLTDAKDAELIAPLVLDEILIRLLRSPLGSRVAHIGQEDSNVQRVAKAVAWLRQHFSEPVTVETLAGMVHMSPSSFHQHFRAVTAMSPLQFQKTLRLREARRLMFSSRMDASSASRQVGYGSASQFSREYGRLFGRAPTRDIALLQSGGPVTPAPSS